MPEHRFYIGFSSNQAPEVNIPQALALLQQAVEITACSAGWQSPDVTGAGPAYVNAVVCCQSRLSPEELKTQVLVDIETRLGRNRFGRQAKIPIDLDILIDGENVCLVDLWTSPHFLLPLAEIIPQVVHPSNGQTLASLSHRWLADNMITPRPDIFLGVNFAG